MKAIVFETKKKDQMINLLIVFFCMIPTLQFFGFVSILIGNLTLVFLGSISIAYCFSNKPFNSQAPFLVFVLFYTLFGIISLIYNGNADIQELLWPLAFMGMGLGILNYKISIKLIRFAFFAYALIMIVLITITGNPELLEGNSSRNTINQIMYLLFSLYFIACYENRKSISILYPMIVLIVCVASVGRSGILMGLLFIGFFLIIKYKNGQSIKKKLYILPIAMLVTAVLLLIVYFAFPDFVKSALDNFIWRKLESKRTIMWSEYIGKVKESFLNFLFGAPIKGTYYLDYYHEDLHNSFFMLHAKYGLGGLLTVIFLFIKSIVTYFKSRNWYYLTPIFVMLFRMSFDYTNFNSFFDIVWVFFVLTPYFIKDDNQTHLVCL